MSEPRQPVIVGGARTPVGRLLGSLASKSASDLGGVAIAGALQRAGIGPERVQYVIMGHVLQAGAGQITARQAAVAAGIAMDVPALTVNKVCLSGLDAIALASQLIRLGEYDVIVAGGMESMTQAPHLLKNSRAGYKYGPVTVEDSMALDGLTDAFDHLSMGESTETSGASSASPAQEQDEFAAASHQRAAAAAKNGLFAAEIVPVPVQHKGEQLTVTEDEGIRPGTTVETLAKLKPAFGHGRHDHGRHRVADLRRRRRGRGHVGRGRAAAPARTSWPRSARTATSPGRTTRCTPSPPTPSGRPWPRPGSTIKDLDLIEINEAFAAVAIQSMRDLGMTSDIVNVNGGAIALGHPIGASGARIALHLANELRRRGGGLGAAGLCGGGGQGEALLLRVRG